jgi:hypothetical protein
MCILVAKKWKRGYCGAPWWDRVEFPFGWALQSGCEYCVRLTCRHLALVEMKMPRHLFYFVKIFYKCTFNAIWKDNASINCTAFQDRKGYSFCQLWLARLHYYYGHDTLSHSQNVSNWMFKISQNVEKRCFQFKLYYYDVLNEEVPTSGASLLAHEMVGWGKGFYR